MLKFTLVENKQGKILYKYFPEGGADFGIVSFSEKTGDVSIETLAKNDRHERYALKMFKRIRAMASKGAFEEEGTVAWY
jgi:hypothetical protein